MGLLTSRSDGDRPRSFIQLESNMEQEHQDHHQSPLSGEGSGSLTRRHLIASQEKIIVVTGIQAAGGQG